MFLDIGSQGFVGSAIRLLLRDPAIEEDTLNLCWGLHYTVNPEN